MKPQKKFDCVKMKWDIQQKIAKEFENIPDKEANKIQMERISKNPILGPFINKVRLSRRKELQKLYHCFNKQN